jgi:hypothetical protein
MLVYGGAGMALTNAERQEKYRAKMKAQGKKRQDEWVNEGGGIALREESGIWPSMTREQLNGAIKKAVACFTGEDAFMKEVVYAEIAAYAGKAAARFEKYNRYALRYR